MIVNVNRNQDLLKIGGNSPININRKTVNNVHIVDASGSMKGGKYQSAIAGINREIAELKSKDDGVDYTMTIIEFDGGSRISFDPTVKNPANKWLTSGDANIMPHYFLTPLADVKEIEGFGANGMTPLYQTVGEVIEALMKAIKPTDATIVTVLTDGDENTSRGKYEGVRKHGWSSEKIAPPVFNQLIESVVASHNITVTFSGTVEDTEKIIATTTISRGNTMSHANTAESINAMYMTRSANVSSFSKSYSAGGASATMDFFAAPDPVEPVDVNPSLNGFKQGKVIAVRIKKEDKIK